MTDEETQHLHPDERIGQARDLTSVELDGETVIYDDRRDQVHLLDAMATVVWSQLDGTEPLGALCQRLSQAFNASADQVRSDVFRLVSDLAELGLAERAADTGINVPRS